MMGLEKLLRGLYGTEPQLDMDRQFARVRVEKPMKFDFKELVDGIRRNNVGTAGIEFDALTEVREGKVVIQPTGQGFPLRGSAPADTGSRQRRLQVRDWNDPELTGVEIVR